jgi:folylpolyglutamate synthase/dihydropteroate synthase
MAHLAPLFDHVVCTNSASPRALSAQGMLAAAAIYARSCQAVEGVGAAIDVAEGIAGRDGFLMVSGSLYTIGEAMQHLEGRHGP